MADNSNSHGESKSTISKSEAVRQAMAKLGEDANRNDLHQFIVKEFGISITPDQVTNLRSAFRHEANKKASKTKTTTTPAPAAKVTPQTVTPKEVKKTPPSSLPGISAISLSDIQTAKDLLTRSTLVDLKRLLELLAG